jgi:hypothetical protein
VHDTKIHHPQQRDETIDEHCARHGFSRSHFYGLQRKGMGVRVVDYAGVRRITPQDNDAWVAQMSAAQEHAS